MTPVDIIFLYQRAFFIFWKANDRNEKFCIGPNDIAHRSTWIVKSKPQTDGFGNPSGAAVCVTSSGQLQETKNSINCIRLISENGQSMYFGIGMTQAPNVSRVLLSGSPQKP